ncbi:MAG: c-type cytochrome [Gammaproteobacteria bacterium]
MKRYGFKILVIAGLLAIAPLTYAADANGQALYEAHCTSCHVKLMGGDKYAIHTRTNSIIHSLDSLKKRVKFCESNNGMNWNDAQIDDVATYLNEAFYKFK